MAQNEKQLANLNPPIRTTKEAKEKGSKGGKASVRARRRRKTLQELAQAASKLPLNELGISRLKRAGLNIDDLDPYDLTGLAAVVIGQMNAAACGNSQAAQVFTDWLDLATKHKKDQLEIERLKEQIEKTKAESEKLRAEIERIRAGADLGDDDMVLRFIDGMQEELSDDSPDAEAD